MQSAIQVLKLKFEEDRQYSLDKLAAGGHQFIASMNMNDYLYNKAMVEFMDTRTKHETKSVLVEEIQTRIGYLLRPSRVDDVTHRLIVQQLDILFQIGELREFDLSELTWIRLHL